MMVYEFKKVLCFAFFITCLNITLADSNQVTPDLSQLPPIEIFYIEPVELESISILVPAAKAGPAINRACQPQMNCVYSFVLPSSVHHEKTSLCPVEAAWLIAEYTAFYHKRSLPLTIFDGWRWEYFYSLSPIESGTYDLPQDGGCWENSWEAVLTQSAGLVCCQWSDILDSGEFLEKSGDSEQKSSIEVKTISCLKARNGYPRKRNL
jgi:hypothetical protein